MSEAILTSAAIQRGLVLGGGWLALTAAWTAACVWVDRDARYVFGSGTKWPLAMAMPGVGLLLSAMLLGFAGLPAILATAMAIGGAYLHRREATVLPPHRVLTRRHAREVLRTWATWLPPGRSAAARRGAGAAAAADDEPGGVTLSRRDGSSPPAIPNGRRHRRAAEADRHGRDIVAEALSANASDVHLDAQADGRVSMRFRIDGVLTRPRSLDGVRLQPLTDAFLAFAGLPPSGRPRQAGRFIATAVGRTVDVRVKTEGKRLTLHLTDSSGGHGPDSGGGLEAIGLSRGHAASIRWAVLQPRGLLLVCGPPSSGRTTTAYAVIAEIDPSAHRIATVEDRVARPLRSVVQTTVDDTAGRTAALLVREAADRGVDVILVDEIRDRTSAAVAVQAADSRTVVATMQAEDAADAIVKLIAFGIDVDQVRTAVAAVLAQRLVRVLCEQCKAPYPAPPEFLEKLGAPGPDDVIIAKKRGCAACHGTGYRGRTPVAEVLAMDDALRQALRDGASRKRIRAAARRSGMKTLREAAVSLVAQAVTSVSEVVRCVP